MPCPVCRMEFKIQQGGFDALQKNFFTERLIDMTKMTNSSAPILCDTCTDGDSAPQTPADKYCETCHMNLCKTCSFHHQRSKLYKEHRLVKVRSEVVVREESPMCPKHSEEMLRIYCKRCGEIVCAFCFVESHQGHEWQAIKEAADDFRKQIVNSVSELSECNSKTTKRRERIKIVKNNIIKSSRQVEDEVLKRRELIKKLADQQADQLLGEIRERRTEKIKELDVAEEDIDRHLVSLESHMDYCKTVVEKGIDFEICRTAKDLKSRASRLECENFVALENPVTPFRLSFVMAKNYEDDSTLNLIGNVKDDDSDILEENDEENTKSNKVEDVGKLVPSGSDMSQPEKIEKEMSSPNRVEECGETEASGNVKAKPERIEEGRDFCDQQSYHVQYREHPSLVHRFKPSQEGSLIWGLTVLDNELFMATGDVSKVECYNSTSFLFVRKWKLNHLRNPQDIISCSKKKCLYIVDWLAKKIFRVDPKGTLIKMWSVSKGCGRLSTTQESNILIACYERNRLREYTSDGEIIQDVNLSLHHPQHAIKLSNGNFVVSHGSLEDISHRVCIVDANGKVLETFGGRIGSTINQMNMPMYLAIDVEQSVLVADCNNGRVLLLDSKLKLMRELISRRDGLCLPRRMFLDSQNGRLLLADNHNGLGVGEIVVFDIMEVHRPI